MKITFLGVSGALSAKYNSNMLIESHGKNMLFDCGEDVMHSLKAAGRTPEELDAVYISHLHMDHCGGLSWLGYYSYFIMNKKLKLYVHHSLEEELWDMLRPSMEKVDGKNSHALSDYFDIERIQDGYGFSFGSMMFYLVKQTHVETLENEFMYSYGLRGKQYDVLDWKFFISSDSKKMIIPTTIEYSDEDVVYDYKCIFCDCDVMNLGGVHPNYDDLNKFDAETKSKMWLYHYTDLNDYDGKFGEMPDAVADGFAGFVKEGQVFEI